jgi:serine/threonine protein kinase
MGQVYRATDSNGEDVALKVMRPELCANVGFRARFEREAKAAAKVDHPQVVRVIDHGSHDGILYVTQPFMRGGSLDVRLERERQLSVERTLEICGQVAAGLDAMHAAGLVHRDLKPPNIMLDEHDVAHVADLGMAKDRDASVVLTKIGQAMGSIHYMSPEQIRAESEPDARTDVYGLGCVVYECVAGAPPFAGREAMQVMWAHLREQPSNPCESRPDFPPRFGEAVLSALHKEPEQRPRSASVYAATLQDAARAPDTEAVR